MTMRDTLRGRLLVASPYVDDPNFGRAVILVCAHDEDGAFGLILNRPLDLPVRDVLPEWGALVAAPPAIFRGGPVNPTNTFALCLDRTRRLGEPVWRDMRLLDLEEQPEALAADPELQPRAVRIFTGYAGWAPGQLESEILDDGWMVVDVRSDDAFTTEPDGLWEAALQRPPARRALVPYFPDEPSLN